MKRIEVVTLLLVSFVLMSCQKKVKIEGKVENGAESVLMLENFNAGHPITLAKTTLEKDGAFDFNVASSDSTEIYNLWLDGKVIRMVLNPEEQVRIQTTKERFGDEYTISGSPQSALLKVAQDSLVSIKRKLNALLNDYQATKDKDKQQQLSQKYEEIFTKHHDFMTHFVYENATSLVGYLGLYQQISPTDFVFGSTDDVRYVRMVAQLLKNKNPNSPYLPLLMNELDKRNEEIRNNKVMQLVLEAENSYPQIALEDSKGDTIYLREIDAKYVLLYFDVLNEKTHKKVEQIYKKYNKLGLQVLFVDKNPSKNAWLDAVTYFNPQYLTVHDSDQMAVAVYNVQRIPSNYIIELKGTIEGKDLFGNYLTERLDKLLR